MQCCQTRPVICFVCVAIAMLLLNAVGCARPDGKLIGKWQMEETEELFETMVGETVDDRIEQLEADGKNPSKEPGFVASQLEIEFASDGSLRTTHMMMNEPYEKAGSWCFEKQEGNDFHFTYVLSGETNQSKVTFIDDDTIRMIPPNFHVLGKQHTFKRVK